MLWILLGCAVGFFVGGAVGTALAPQRGADLLTNLPERLREARAAALRAAEQAEQATVERSHGPRGGRRRRRGRRR